MEWVQSSDRDFDATLVEGKATIFSSRTGSGRVTWTGQVVWSQSMALHAGMTSQQAAEEWAEAMLAELQTKTREQ